MGIFRHRNFKASTAEIDAQMRAADTINAAREQQRAAKPVDQSKTFGARLEPRASLAAAPRSSFTPPPPDHLAVNNQLLMMTMLTADATPAPAPAPTACSAPAPSYDSSSSYDSGSSSSCSSSDSGSW